MKKSAAARPSQCAARKVFQDVFAPRSGAGSMPWSLRIALIVLRATSWPTPFSPPRIRVYPPGWVLGRHAHDERRDLWLGARATKPSRLRAVVLLGDKAAIPPQDGVRRDDAGDGCKTAPAEDFAFHRQAAALVVGETQTSGSVRRAEHPILLEQIVMTACCCRLTQPENSRTKNARGGGNGSMAEACPRRCAGSRTMSIRPDFRGHIAPVWLRRAANYRLMRHRRSFRTGRHPILELGQL